jgi:hypothetical protein
MHYTITQSEQDIDPARIPEAQVQFVPGHDLGGGYTRHLVELGEGDTSSNPASTKGPILGPCFVCYDRHRTGISVQIYKDAGGFYDDIFETRKQREAMRAARLADG